MPPSKGREGTCTLDQTLSTRETLRTLWERHGVMVDTGISLFPTTHKKGGNNTPGEMEVVSWVHHVGAIRAQMKENFFFFFALNSSQKKSHLFFVRQSPCVCSTVTVGSQAQKQCRNNPQEHAEKCPSTDEETRERETARGRQQTRGANARKKKTRLVPIFSDD